MKDETLDTAFLQRHNKKKSRPLQQWHDAKKQLILKALLRNDGCIKDTSAELGISTSQLWRYRKQYGLPIRAYEMPQEVEN